MSSHIGRIMRKGLNLSVDDAKACKIGLHISSGSYSRSDMQIIVVGVMDGSEGG